MSKGTFQQVIIIGNCGNDPELKYMPNGNSVANFNVATSESWKDKQGQQQDRTEWHRCTAYRKLAEIIGEYVRKGSKIQIVGKLQTHEWQDKDGQKRYTTEVVIHEMQMLDGKPQDNSYLGDQSRAAQQQQAVPQRQAPQQQQRQAPSQQQRGFAPQPQAPQYRR